MIRIGRFKNFKTPFLLLIFLVIFPSFAKCDDDDFQLNAIKKDVSGPKAPRRPRPRPAPPPPAVLPDPVAQFTVQAPPPVIENLNPCNEFSSDPCACSFSKTCEFDEVTGKCVPSTTATVDKFKCHHPNVFYAFSSDVVCTSPETLGNCSELTHVYSVNLNGFSYQDSHHVLYKSEKSVITLDTDSINVPSTATCTVNGLESEDDAKALYQTMVIGNVEKRDPGLCVAYPIPIIQDGDYELTIKFVAEAGRCMDIKLGGATAAVDLNLMKLAKEESCKALEVAILFSVEQSSKRMHIKGQKNFIPINGGFSLKLCYGECDDVPNAIYGASAFSLVRFGEDSMVFDNMELQVMTFGDGTQVFKAVNLKVRMYSQIQLQFGAELFQNKVQKQLELKAKLEEEVEKKVEEEETLDEQLKESCPKIPKGDEVQCRKAKCAYDLATETCNSNEISCAMLPLGVEDCFRSNSYYLSAGILCKTLEQQEGECPTEDIILAVNIFGDSYRDVNGIDYSSGKIEISKIDFETVAEYVNLNSAENIKCRKDDKAPLEISDGGTGDVELYDTVVRGKDDNKADFNFPIEGITDGSYELAIKTIDPIWSEAGKRAFTIKLNGEIIVKNLDVAAHVGACTGMNIVSQFQVIGDMLVIPGLQSKDVSIADNKLIITFAYGDDSLGHEDHRFILSALSLIKLQPATDEHVANIAAPLPEAQPDIIETTPVPTDIELYPHLVTSTTETSIDEESQTTLSPDDPDSPCDECEALANNPKGCKQAGLEYNLVTNECLKEPSDCKSLFTEDTCLRSTVTYVSAGVPCQTKNDLGECGMQTLIHGVNLNGEKHTDSHGLTFRPENNFALDSDGVRENGTLVGTCEVEGSTKNDADILYSTFVIGKEVPGTCIMYDVPICQDGFYELRIKFSDDTAINERCFNIGIDDTVLMAGVDITKLAKGEKCAAVDLAFPFTAEPYGTSNILILSFEGLDELIFVEMKFHLKFCACEWEAPKPSFKASAFSLQRFGEGTIPCDVYNIYNGNEAGCLKIDGEYNSKKGICGFSEKPADICPGFEGNANACKQQGCEYNLVSGKCEIGLTQGGGKCEPSIFENSFNCKRPNAYYTNGGVMCLNMMDIEEPTEVDPCKTITPIWGVNLNGKHYLNERKTFFLGEDPLFAYDPLKIKLGVNFARFCSDTDKAFQKFYSTAVSGNPTKEIADSCLSYTFPICQDGFYELSLFMLDGQNDAVNKRCFDIKLNNVQVAFSVDPARLGAMGDEAAVKKCARIEIIILFKIANDATELTPLGHTTATPIDGNVQLSLCYGTCGYADPLFVLSGYSVKRFGTKKETTTCDKCAIFHRNPTSCEKWNCEYHPATNKCWTSYRANFCRQFEDDPCFCILSGCRFESSNNACVVEDKIFANKLSCRRPRSHYAFQPKILCQYEATGDCSHGVPVFGVNAHGKDHIDADGLYFKKEAVGMILDPRDIRKIVNSKKNCSIPDVSEEDRSALYKSVVFGQPSKMKTGACLAYPIPLTQDGDYELVIKMLDEVWDKEMRRCFGIRINDVPVAVELDLVKIAGKDQCGAVDLSLLFIIENEKTSMRIKGHSAPIAISGGFHLQFCFGTNACKKIPDRSFAFSAFSLIRYGDDTILPDIMKQTKLKSAPPKLIHPCEMYNDDANDCKENNCEYDQLQQKCLHATKDCPTEMFAKYSKCQRSGAVYNSGGLNCLSKTTDGNCLGQVIHSINLGSKDKYIFSERQLTFKPEKPTDSIADSSGIRSTYIKSEINCGDESIDNTRKNLLLTGVTGETSKTSKGCLSYPINVKDDGRYELSIWTVDVKASEANLNCFDILLNYKTIFSAVDPYKLSGKECGATELIILFEVTNSGTKLNLIGHPNSIDIINGKVNLNFCFGNCGYAQDVSFYVSAFSLIKFGEIVTEGDPCEDYKDDNPLCHFNGCEYNVNRKRCVYEMKTCTDDIFSDPLQCRRKDAYYIKSGILCKNLVDGGECSANKVETVVAINLGGKTVEYRNVTYDQETAVDLAAGWRGATNIIYSHGHCNRPEDRKDSIFKELLSSIILGPMTKRACVQYPFALLEDGLYEISILALEGAAKDVNKRFFDIQFNDISLAYNIDLFRIKGGKCFEVELIILLQLKNFMTEVWFHGFPGPLKVNGQMHLKFCNAYLSSNKALHPQDYRFQVSAFSVTKLMSTPNTENDLKTSVNPCIQHGKDLNACRKNNCEFDLRTGTCVSKITACSNTELDSLTKCRRARAVYGSGGVLCRNKKDSEEGSCSGETIIAFNLGGEEYIDTTRNLKYTMEIPTDFVDPTGSRKPETFDRNCNRERKDPYYKNLISPTVFGNMHVARQGCVTYPISLKSDGIYELSLLGTEHNHKTQNKRCFDILFNFVPILYAVDHVYISGRTCRINEMIVLFKVENDATQLIPAGFTKPIPIDKSVNLKFCFGSCGYYDVGYLLSAFSIVKFGSDENKVDPTDSCGKFNGNPCECKKNGCEYKSDLGFCLSTPTECPATPTGCSRNGAWYANAGVMCKHVGETSENCAVAKTVIAVNMGGEAHTDKDNIAYSAYFDVPFETVDGIKEMDEENVKVSEKDQADVYLYKTYIAGNPNNLDNPNECLKYNVPLTNQGNYELIIKIGDFESTAQGEKTVNYKLNQIKIVEELDIIKYTGEQYGVADIIVPFQVFGDGNILDIAGLGRSSIKGGVIPLEFCNGLCSENGIKTVDWRVSAWAVVQLPDK